MLELFGKFQNGVEIKQHGIKSDAKIFEACDAAEFRCKDCKKKSFADDHEHTYSVTQAQNDYKDCEWTYKRKKSSKTEPTTKRTSLRNSDEDVKNTEPESPVSEEEPPVSDEEPPMDL